MIEILFGKIQEHLTLLDHLVQVSEKIRDHARNQKLDEVVSETENRERLVSIVAKIQGEVEDKINQLDGNGITSNEIQILKSWFQDLNDWSEKILICDQEAVEYLDQQKENTTKEIATIFRSKEIFKGYNHLNKK
jgi:hypothetical protein